MSTDHWFQKHGTRDEASRWPRCERWYEMYVPFHEVCDAQGARVRGLLCLASGLEHWPAIQRLEGASGGDEADISDMTYRDERVPSRILPEAQRTILQAASPNRREKAIVALLPGKVLYFVALPASTALHLSHPPVVLLPEHSNPACRRSPAKQTPSSDLTRLRSEAPLPSPP